MKSLSAVIFSALACVTSIRAADTPAAAPVKIDGFSYVKTVGAISEYKLEANGLTVLILPEHSAPVVTFMITYRVGSRNEVTGTTGATHLLEHLMFKGSDAFNRAKGTSVDQFLERVGGNYNATTYLDRTNYYAEIGNEHLEGYMAIEADRMRNLWLREADRRPEMTVVRNEFEIGENDPMQALDKEIFAAAFQAHPYHHSTIGWRSDIEKVSIEKLREFYDTFYWPDNATATIVGDFDPAAGLALIKKYYGVIPRALKPIPQVYTEEPAQSGPRRVTVRRAGELGVVGVSYKSPAATHPDLPALNVLASILSSGKTSRFYRALTDKNLTLGVDASAGYFHDPSLFQIYANLAPGAAHEQVEKIVLDEVERVKAGGVTAAEIATALGKIKAATSFKRDGYFSIAGNLNEDIAAGDWTLYYTLDAATAKVTAAEVQRVAQQYLDLNQSVTGWFIPLAPAAEAGAPAKK